MIRSLKNGRYFYQVSEKEIQEIEITNAMYFNSEVWYNDGGYTYDIDRIRVKDGNLYRRMNGEEISKSVNCYYGGYLPHGGYWHESRKFYIKTENEVIYRQIQIFKGEIKDTHIDIKKVRYFDDNGDQHIVEAEKVFDNLALARECEDITISLLNGDKEEIPSILTLLKEDEKQSKLIKKMQDLLVDFKKEGIGIFYNRCNENLCFINTKNLEVDVSFDIPSDGEDITINPCILSSFGNVRMVDIDSEDSIVVKRK